MPVKRTSQKQAKSIKIIEQALFADDLLTMKNGSDFNQEFKQKNDNKAKKQFSTISELLSNHPIKKSNKYISQEFQAFGCHMATVLEDQAYTSMYIKLAKTYPRAILEQALAFVSDAQNARSKAKLFMWKLDQLKKRKQTSGPKQQARKS